MSSEVFVLSKWKTFLCYWLRVQFVLTLIIIFTWIFNSNKFEIRDLVYGLLIIFVLFPFGSSILTIIDYWRFLFQPKEIIVQSDRVAFKWKNKEKVYIFSEIKEVLSSGGIYINAYFPVVIVFYLKNGKAFQLSRCFWNYNEFLDLLEEKGVKVTRVRKRFLTKEERKKYRIVARDN